jgi:peptidoglycan/LPS O-acetylase OafA/YrhL
MAMGYRSDIDGLRAVAVISVVAYHVGVPAIGGGFIGVDVFFVISGFLITKLLVAEQRERGSIDLLSFYARRARRLLPAFFLVVAATLLLGWFFLVPLGGEQKSLARSAIAAAIYVANIHFARTTGGYFDDSSELQPLLHTWSLAVEEQFYLVWPLLLLACGWVATRWRVKLLPLVLGVLAVIFTGSLIYSWLVSEGSARAAHGAFFLLSSRAWELAVGAFLALALLRSAQVISKPVGIALSWVGLLAIAFSAAAFTEGMPFPGAVALLPTLGAAAVIAGTWMAPRAGVAQFLSSPPLVGIGLLSYSWYLWHWPLLAIVRAQELGAKELWRDSLVAILALGLAWATYVFIEAPIRRRHLWGGWSNLRVMGAAAVGAMLLIAGAKALQTHAEIAASKGPLARLALVSVDKGWSRERCFHDVKQPFRKLIPVAACMQAVNADKYFLVWGDSHADHFASMTETAAAAYGIAVLPRTMSGCPPLLNVNIMRAGKSRDDCARFNTAVLEEIDEALHRKELAGVVLSGRWSHYLGRPELNGNPPDDIVADVGRNPSVDAAPGALAHGLKTALDALTRLGVRVLVVAPVPEQQFDVLSCLARKPVEFCSVARDTAEQHRAVALGLVRAAIDISRGVRLWDTEPALCPDGRCWAERDHIVIYRDNDHLSPSGSRWLAPYFADEAAWLVGVSGRAASAAGRASDNVPQEVP